VKVLERLRKKWISITLLSIVIPIGLLITFRLTGTLPEPQTPISVLAETISWQIDRPTMSVEIKDTVKNLYKNENISMIFTIDISHYSEGHSFYGGDDMVPFSVKVNCSVARGFVERVDLFLRDESNKTQVMLPYNSPVPFSERLFNLSVEEWAQCFSYVHPPEGFKEKLDITNPLKSYLKTVGVDQPSSVRLSNVFGWILRTPNNQSHQLEVTLELTHWDQTAYKKIVAPIILNIVADEDDSFETARVVNKGHHKAYVHIWDDPEDYYKIWLENGETITMQLSPQLSVDLDLYLYDPGQNLAASSNSTQLGFVEQITYTANQSGWWYIRVVLIYAGFDVYSLSLEGGST